MFLYLVNLKVLFICLLVLSFFPDAVDTTTSPKYLRRRMRAQHYPPTCYIEEGFDFVDNDLKNQTASQAEDCCELCYATTNCKAFSWNDYNGGTCWLKTGQGRIIQKEGVRSALVYPYPGPDQCHLDIGVDIVGNDLGNVPGADASTCCEKCQKFPGCRAFSWTNFNGGTCWLKSRKGKTLLNGGVTSGTAYPDPIYPSCALQLGIDFVGNDIGSTAAPNAAACCSLCQNNISGCRGFTWTNYQGGTCWFKNLVLDTVENPDATSCLVLANPPAPACAMHLDADYDGNDIGTASSKDSWGCCSICLKTPECKAFTWSNWNGGTCFLKNRKTKIRMTPGLQSGVVGPY